MFCIVVHNLSYIWVILHLHLIFSLNADHDGDGNACSDEDRFIMSATVIRDANYYKNAFGFSTCSKQAFTSKINDLNA